MCLSKQARQGTQRFWMFCLQRTFKIKSIEKVFTDSISCVDIFSTFSPSGFNPQLDTQPSVSATQQDVTVHRAHVRKRFISCCCSTFRCLFQLLDELEHNPITVQVLGKQKDEVRHHSYFVLLCFPPRLWEQDVSAFHSACFCADWAAVVVGRYNSKN